MNRTSLEVAESVDALQSENLRESDRAVGGMTSRRVLMLAWCGIVLVAVVAVLWSRPDSMSGSRSGTSSNAVTIGGADEFNLSQSTIPREQFHRGGPAKDGIPAISTPQLISAADATFLKPEDRVIGVVLKDLARAYPIRILNYHEIVNDRIDTTPIAVTYCPLCDSACVFDRRTPLGEREFGVSGLLYNSNVLMYDRRSKPESLWSQVRATGVTGPGMEKPLKTLPVELTTWTDWKERYPASEVLSLDTGHRRDYSSSPYSSYFTTPQLMFPVNHEDNRLPRKTRVLGIWSDKSQMAVPETLFTGKGEDTEFESTLDGLKFTVRYSSESKSLRVVTADSGLNWMYSLWFAWAALHPQTDIQTLP
ncbi:MAG: DUF3179 domain-containing protein [Planctomycetaceae bacterium]|nr:DUF3179 domain-containing protein [Planctomycetaceae bacterium]